MGPIQTPFTDKHLPCAQVVRCVLLDLSRRVGWAWFWAQSPVSRCAASRATRLPSVRLAA